MSHHSDATFARQVEHLLGCVERLKAGGRNAGYFLLETMKALVAVQAAIARDHPEPEAVAAFRRRSAAELASLDRQVRSYVRLVADQAETDAEGVLPEVCTRRSAIELVRTEYGGTSAAEAIDPADVARMDAAIRRLAEEQGPVLPGEIIPGLPASHWWWTYPRRAPRRHASGPHAAVQVDAAMFESPEYIDYASFDDERLLRLAIQDDELFIATHALTELRLRGPAQARTAAEIILNGDRADRHLRALAIAALFDGDIRMAMPTLLDVVAGSDDPKVLATLMEGVVTRPDAFTSASGQRLIAALTARASVVGPDAFTDAEAWAEFVGRFGDAAAASAMMPVDEPPRVLENIMTKPEPLIDAARRVTPVSPPTVHAWQLITRGIAVGWMGDAELVELEEHLRARRDFGIEELLFANLGDQLRVSFLDDHVECDRRELLDALSGLLLGRSRAP